MADSTNKWLAVIAGIVAILFGLFAFAMPGVMLASLVLFFAIFALIQAIILIVSGIMAGGEPGSARWFLIGTGVILLILGALALYNPTGFVLAITFLIGLFIFVMGLFQLWAGIAGREMPYWWLTLIAGIIGIIAGLYIMTQPVAGTVVLVWLLGIWAIIFGIERIVMAFVPARPAATVAV